MLSALLGSLACLLLPLVIEITLSPQASRWLLGVPTRKRNHVTHGQPMARPSALIGPAPLREAPLTAQPAPLRLIADCEVSVDEAAAEPALA